MNLQTIMRTPTYPYECFESLILQKRVSCRRRQPYAYSDCPVTDMCVWRQDIFPTYREMIEHYSTGPSIALQVRRTRRAHLDSCPSFRKKRSECSDVVLSRVWRRGEKRRCVG